MIQDPAFQGEGRKAQKAQQWHFKDPPLGKEGNGIDPFRSCPEIPEFPQQPARQASEDQAPDAAPVAGGYREREASNAKPFQQRIEKENRAEPDGGEKIARPQQRSDGENDAQDEDHDGGPGKGLFAKGLRLRRGASSPAAEEQSVDQIRCCEDAG